MKTKKNRFELAENAKTINLYDGKENAKERNTFRIFLVACSLILISLLLTFIFHYFYVHYGFSFWSKITNKFKSDTEDSFLQERILPDGNQINPEERYYMPLAGANQTLQQAINHYTARELRQATTKFEQVINGGSESKDKAIALTYLGVIALERDQYELARHQFLRALQYEPKAIGAIVNLSILERKLNNYNAAKEYALKASNYAPQDKTVLLLLANLLLKNQKTDEAISTYQKAIVGTSDSNEDALVYYNLGISYLRKGNLETAIENFRHAITKTKSTSLKIRAHAQLGQLYFQKGDLNLASDHLRHTVRLAPQNGKYSYNLGIIYLHKKETETAYNFFQQSLKSTQGTPDVYRALAKALVRINKTKEAMGALQKALYINPGDLATLFQLGEFQHKSNQLELAAASYRKIVNITPGDKNTQDALRYLSDVYVDMERHNSAIDVLEKAIILKPKNPEAYLLLGEIYNLTKRRDLAINSWKKALAKQTQNNKLRLKRELERSIRLSLAHAYRQEGAYDLALQQYDFIKERNNETPAITPIDPELELEWANTYFAQKNFKKAIIHLKLLSTARNTSFEQRKTAYLKLAHAWASQGNNPAFMHEAIANVNKALRMAPDEPQVILTHGWVLLQSNTAVNREKAIEVLTALTSSAIDSDLLIRGYNLLGKVYMENSEYQRALNAFEYTLRIDPANKEAYKNQQAAVNALENEK